MTPNHDSFPDRAIIHVDMDAFYASVEVMDNPELAGLPVIVGGEAEERGVVAAASYEARVFGVHSAMSSYRARKLCPQAVFVRPRMMRYVELSRAVRAVLDSFTPLVEPISIDEAFLDVSGCRRLFGTPEEIGRTIKQRIRDEVGLVASVGVAPNKFLAKLASDLDKPDGFTVIPAAEARERLAPLPVGRLWGVGKVAQKSLAKVGIHTVGDITRMPLSQLDKLVGSWAPRLKQLAVGDDDRPVVPEQEAKSISAETTFVKDIGDEDELRHVLDTLVERVARRVRSSGLVGYTVQLKARYADFTTVTRAMTLSGPTAQTPAIRDAARELLSVRLGRKGRPLRLIGIGVSHFVRREELPPLLFRDATEEKHDVVDEVVDQLQDRFGHDAIHRGTISRKNRE
jgi:DNA polymerase-4